MHGNKGKKRTPVQIERMRVARTGILHTQETKDRISAKLKGKVYTKETIKKISEAKLIDNPGYGAIHDWVRRWKGTPNLCENCGATDRYMNWANIDHQYKRVLEDYIRLCVPCHREFDKKFD